MKTFLVVVNYNSDTQLINSSTFTYVNYKALLTLNDKDLENLLIGIDGLILSGGPQHIPEMEAYPELSKEITLIRLAVQKGALILGICLGFQLLNHYFHNKVHKLESRIVGCNKMDKRSVNTNGDETLASIDFDLLCSGFSFHYDGVKENHNDDILVVAIGVDNIVYFIKHRHLPIFGIQSHPEARHLETQKCLKKYNVDEYINLPNEDHFRMIRQNFFSAILGVDDIF
jgi:gamma-glutamyl-gamma-aminobutyrate hydrolase PuuD